MEFFSYTIKAILAGMVIAVSCYANLLLGGVLGAFIFAFGLTSVIFFKLNLFTGAVGKVFWNDGPKIWQLIIFYLGNFVGAIAVTLLIGGSVASAAGILIAKYVTMGFWQLFAMSIFCGMAVYFGVCGERDIIKIILCVMTFVLCGFPHCIAAMGYIGFAIGAWPRAWVLVPITMGNIAGSLLADLCHCLNEKE